MDSWLISQFRIAERQGLLTGKHINSVQRGALTMLMIEDQRQALNDSTLQEPYFEVEEVTEENFDDDDEEVTYSMPEMAGRDAESVLAQLGGIGSFSAEDVVV